MSAFPDLPLEDNPEDIVGKAQRGLGLTEPQLAERAGLSTDVVVALLEGQLDESALRAVAPVLALDADSLVRQANGDFEPEPVELEGLLMANTEFDDMTVNAFIVFDPATRVGALFDTGAKVDPLVEQARALDLNIEQVFLTHTHADHIADLGNALQDFAVGQAMVGEGEGFAGAVPFASGAKFAIGNLQVETRLTWGHAKGGITFVISGLKRPLAIVGDAIFAGSMGGGKESYADALETNRQAIFTLPDDTVVACGHGPLTSVGEEKANNPFFPEFKQA